MSHVARYRSTAELIDRVRCELGEIEDVLRRLRLFADPAEIARLEPELARRRLTLVDEIEEISGIGHRRYAHYSPPPPPVSLARIIT